MCERCYDPTQPFADLESDMSLAGDPAGPVHQVQVGTFFAGHIDVPGAPLEVPCTRCSGTGNTRWGKCFKCDGSGKMKEPKQLMMDAAHVKQRAASKIARATTRVKQLADQRAERDAWYAAHKDVVQWLNREAGHTNTFALSLSEQLSERGSLSEKQVICVRNSIMDKQIRAEQRANAAPSVAGAGFEKLVESFTAARATGLKFPTLRVGDITLSLAGAKAKQQGAIYVKVGGNYQGKIMDGKFHKTYACTDALQDKIVEIGKDPMAAAISHGRLTGACACCGRRLVDPVSVERGIGPICATKFGW
jgi:hypothetical protein